MLTRTTLYGLVGVLIVSVFAPFGVTFHAAAQDVKDDASPATTNDDPKPPDPKELKLRIDRLITELDDPNFKTRQNAQKALIEIGAAVLPAVTKAAKSESPEVRYRAAEVLKALQHLVSGLKKVENFGHDDLEYVVSAEVSDDGRFLYAASWRANTVTVFRRNAENGKLEHEQTLRSDDYLEGAVCLRVSPDGKLAASTGFRSKAVALYERKPQNGRLKFLNAAVQDQNGVTGIQWPIDVAWSPNSKFLYVVDGRGQDGSTVTCFRVTDDRTLEWIEATKGRDDCFANSRGIATSPDGGSLYVTSSDAGTLVVLSRDAKTGKTEVRQILKDETGDVHALMGVSSVAASSDGKFVYTSSGRFLGDSAVSAFKVEKDGTLSVMQEFMSDETAEGDNAIKNFLGGNEILITSDGRNVYAAGTRSSSIACFDRDPKTGRLTVRTTIDVGNGELGPAGLGVSPDGKFLYAAVEGDGVLAIFERNIANKSSSGDPKSQP